MSRKRLVLFVEGHGETLAAHTLAKCLLTERSAWNAVLLDPEPFRVKGLGSLAKNNAAELIRFARFASRDRPNLGGILLLVDGDLDRFLGAPFCAQTAASYLAQRAREAGAGVHFSLATVIALQEYESWLIAGMEALVGKPLPPDDRPGVKEGTTAPSGNLETAPRDAKGWLSKRMHGGYKPSVDQDPMTRLLVKNLAPLRERGLRSFSRFENALTQLVAACRTGKHIATP